MHSFANNFPRRFTTLFVLVAGLLSATAQSTSSHSSDPLEHRMAHRLVEDQSVFHPVFPPVDKATSCSAPVRSHPSTYWLDQQDHTGNARGYAPFLPDDFTYPVYRNVKSYHALGDGVTDDTQALQNAINDDGSGGNRYNNEVSTRPAQVFVPGGTYVVTKQLDLRLNTILVGDPNDRPVFKAARGFEGGTVLNGYDYATRDSGGTTAFFTAVKNVVVDTTAIAPDTNVVALQWGVAQGCQLSNVRINMPTYSTGHTGIALDQGSTTIVSDVVSYSRMKMERVFG